MNERETATPSSGNQSEPRPQHAENLRRWTWWSLVGVLIGLILVVVALRHYSYDPTPELTPHSFAAALERWQSREISDYDAEIRVTGPQPATYRVQVRGGEAQAAWRNGSPLRTRRTFGTWSVPGMFSTISRDLAALELAAREGRPPPLIVRARFQDQWGYPERYQRIDNGSRRGGDSSTVTWDVLHFQVIGTAPGANRPADDDSAFREGPENP